MGLENSRQVANRNRMEVLNENSRIYFLGILRFYLGIDQASQIQEVRL